MVRLLAQKYTTIKGKLRDRADKAKARAADKGFDFHSEENRYIERRQEATQ